MWVLIVLLSGNMAEKNETDFILNYMSEVEAVAEEILTSKQHMIELDKKRQKSREAIRVLQKDKTSTKQWVCFGNMFIKMPSKETKLLLEKENWELICKIHYPLFPVIATDFLTYSRQNIDSEVYSW
uniref:P53 and DNA damage-regulated protein 1 n=1 Tax=Magallana gigas TaxID=29159 RepID=A0A8W8NDM5_MAGGI